MPLKTFTPSAPSPSIPGSEPPADVPLAPPPWTLTAKLYLFVTGAVSANITQPPTTITGLNASPDVLQGLPLGAYPPLEQIHPSALALIDGKPQYRGGLSKIVLVRYSASPAGPYDEIILIGTFKDPNTGEITPRITNIYVSADNSVWNGRRNWNIPKHRARFEWTETGPRTSTVKIYHPSDIPGPLSSETPFFSAIVNDSRLPSVPVNTSPSIFNSATRLVQPPILPGLYPKDSPLAAAAIGTDGGEGGRDNGWLQTVPVYKGWAKPAYIVGALGEEQSGGKAVVGDGVGFPQYTPWRIGGCFEGTIDFPASTVVGKSKTA